jgi:hypothetical protein
MVCSGCSPVASRLRPFRASRSIAPNGSLPLNTGSTDSFTDSCIACACGSYGDGCRQPDHTADHHGPARGRANAASAGYLHRGGEAARGHTNRARTDSHVLEPDDNPFRHSRGWAPRPACERIGEDDPKAELFDQLPDAAGHREPGARAGPEDR